MDIGYVWSDVDLFRWAINMEKNVTHKMSLNYQISWSELADPQTKMATMTKKEMSLNE
jgi:hypothetical protein